MFRSIIAVLLTLFCFTKFTHNILAADLLSENFNTSEINTSLWQVLNETSIPILDGNWLNMSNVDASRSAFIQNLVSLDTSNGIEYRVRFKFNNLAFGSGIAFNDVRVPLRQLNIHPGMNDWTIFVWPTSSNVFKVFSVSCPVVGPCLPTDNPLFTVSGLPAFDWHELSVIYSGGVYRVSLDSLSEKITLPIARPPSYIWVGNPMITNGVLFTNFSIDYIKVKNLITFPYLSQKDGRWANEEYDSAGEWAGTGKTGIDRWGCALTSAAMILQKYGVKAPDGTEIDPSKLNAWLKGQSDGYIGLGHVNWLAIARYAKGIVPGGKSLEFQRSYDPSTAVLPVILGLPGHYVVAHDEDTLNWKINDPASTASATLAKTSTIKSVNRYEVTSSDLSYMLMVKNSGVATTLTDPLGNPVALTWDEEFLQDDVDGGEKPKIFSGYVPKPVSGKYLLGLDNTGTDIQNLTIYLYDLEGQVFKKELVIDPGASKYEIGFDRSDSATSEVELVDEIAPILSNRTSFSGWYKTPQTAYFTYTDDNMLDDYSDPSCVISVEGENQTCTIQPNVCDKSGNCNTTPQICNPINLDMTPPRPPKIVWIGEWWQRILLAWNPVVDGEKYVIYLGPKTSELSKVGEANENYWISQFMKPGRYYVAISAVDKAGNESQKSKIVKVEVKRRWR